MYEGSKDCSPYSLWHPEVMKDCCRFALQGSETSTQVELCCNPETETSVHMGHHSLNLTSSLSQIDVSVTVLRDKISEFRNGNKIDFLAPPTWPKLSSAFLNGTDIHLPDLTHFIPMQNPELTASYISSF